MFGWMRRKHVGALRRELTFYEKALSDLDESQKTRVGEGAKKAMDQFHAARKETGTTGLIMPLSNPAILGLARGLEKAAADLSRKKANLPGTGVRLVSIWLESHLHIADGSADVRDRAERMIGGVVKLVRPTLD